VNLKPIAILFFFLCCLHNYVGNANYFLPNSTGNNCNNKLILSFASWDSACIYTAYQSVDPSWEHINYEHQKLTLFTSKNGFSPEVLKYRVFFYARFQDQFNISNTELKKIFNDFTLSKINDINTLVFIIEFFSSKKEYELAQEVLDNYCLNFFQEHNTEIIKGIDNFVNSNSIGISLETCNNKFNL